jgi:caffeoyl-CoA O-methyltransferase
VTDKFTALTPELHRYLIAHSGWRDEVAERVEEAAEETEVPMMQIPGDQAALTTILVRAIGARRALEVGTFLGYGAISIARGLPGDGRLISCELDPDHAARAREHLEAAGLADRVEIRIGPALETIRSMSEDDGPIDFAFIDADKQGYSDYFEEILARTRPGGLIALDNMLMGGRVLDPPADDDATAAIAALNDRLAADRRVDVAMLGVADGITLALRR